MNRPAPHLCIPLSSTRGSSSSSTEAGVVALGSTSGTAAAAAGAVLTSIIFCLILSAFSAVKALFSPVKGVVFVDDRPNVSCEADSYGAAFLPLPARVVVVDDDDDDDDDADGTEGSELSLRIRDPALGTA